MLMCFCCFAERKSNEIPQEYKVTKVFIWSKEKHGREYFEKYNWQWRLRFGNYMDPHSPCGVNDSPCIVIEDTCVHFDPFHDFSLIFFVSAKSAVNKNIVQNTQNVFFISTAC